MVDYAEIVTALEDDEGHLCRTTVREDCLFCPWWHTGSSHSNPYCREREDLNVSESKRLPEPRNENCTSIKLVNMKLIDADADLLILEH